MTARRSNPRTSGPAGVRRWALQRTWERLRGKAQGREFRRYEPFDTTGRDAVEWFEPAHLYRKKTRLPVLFDPPMVPATTLGLSPDELVLGVERDGEARLYPTSTLRVHHVVNDRIGGARILIAFCQKCYTGAAFDPMVDGRALTFEMFGMYQGAAVIRDLQTGTLWAHGTGDALVGVMAGKRMTLVPVEMAEAGRWLDRFPDSLAPSPRVMAKPNPFRPGGAKLDHENLATITRFDPRLEPRALVLGVSAGRAHRAYVLDPGQPGPRLFQDEVGGVPVALLADPGSWPLAYDRTTDGGVLDLRLVDGRITDAAGTVWTGAAHAVQGPLTGTRLRFLASRVGEWHAWSAYRPSTDVVRPVHPPET